MQEIYIDAYKKTTVIKKKNVTLKEIAEISAPTHLKTGVEQVCVFKVPKDEKKDYLISIIDLIDAIKQYYPDVSINNVGEKDMIIAYLPEAPKENKVWEWTKIIVICFIIFAGATMAIMAYQTDTSLAESFQALNKLFTGENVDNPVWITVPYSIGLFVGVTFFYNHIGHKKIMDDPTPLQIEITKYEKDVEDAIIDDITYKERGE
ncbi:MAG: stage V sporulation protein AA [Cellulosilyticaceae bacterium]